MLHVQLGACHDSDNVNWDNRGSSELVNIWNILKLKTTLQIKYLVGEIYLVEDFIENPFVILYSEYLSCMGLWCLWKNYHNFYPSHFRIYCFYS